MRFCHSLVQRLITFKTLITRVNYYSVTNRKTVNYSLKIYVFITIFWKTSGIFFGVERLSCEQMLEMYCVNETYINVLECERNM